jgi:hypothetical protein
MGANLLARGSQTMNTIARHVSFGTAPKYKNKPIVVKGIKFPSQREARAWGCLELLEKAGRIRDLKRQVTYTIAVNGQTICRYIADFVFEEDRGKGEWVKVVADSKGFPTPVYQLKRKLMRIVLGIEIREM